MISGDRAARLSDYFDELARALDYQAPGSVVLPG
jgi:hypothetical protein